MLDQNDPFDRRPAFLVDSLVPLGDVEDIKEKEQLLQDKNYDESDETLHNAHFDGVAFEKPERRGRREDFKVFALLGEGSFGSVVLAKKKSTGGHSSSEEVLAIKFVFN
jgi:hypothetical protein